MSLALCMLYPIPSTLHHRPRRPIHCVEEETFDDQDRARILQYAGFVRKFLHVSDANPSLTWYTQLPWFLRFVSFLIDVREAGAVGCHFDIYLGESVPPCRVVQEPLFLVMHISCTLHPAPCRRTCGATASLPSTPSASCARPGLVASRRFLEWASS